MKIVGSNNPKKYRVTINGGTVAENTSGIFSFDVAAMPEGTLKVSVMGGDGKWKNALKTSVSVISDAKIDVKLEKLFSLTVPDNVPLIGGEDMELSLEDLPVGVTFDLENRTFAVAMGIKKDLIDSGENKKESNIKKFGEHFKEFKKELKEDMSKGKDEYRQLMEKSGLKGLQQVGEWKWGLEFTGAGYFEGTFDSDGIASVSGNLYLSLNGSGSGNWQTALWAVPVTVKLKVSGSISTVLGIEIKEGWSLDPVIPALDITIPKIKVSAGPGFKNLNASVYGEAKNTITYQPYPYLLTSALSGEVGISVKAWIFSGELPILSGKWMWYNSAKRSNAPAMAKAAPNGSDYMQALMQSDTYKLNVLENTSAWYGSSASGSFPMLGSTPGLNTNGITSKLLQERINTAADPKIVEAGDTIMMVWTGTDSQRNNADKSVLVYSLYDKAENTWSAPAAIADDSTADCNPDVASDGKDIYVVWTNTDATLPDTVTIEEYGKHTETAVCKFDTETSVWSEQYIITSNDYADVSPDIYAQDGKAYISWIANKQNDILQFSGENLVCCAEWDGQSSAVKTVKSMQKKEMCCALRLIPIWRTISSETTMQ